MRHSGIWRLTVFLTLLLGGIASTGLPPIAHAEYQCKVAAFPTYAQEGSTITLVLTCSGATPGTRYEFDFFVRDPSTTWWQSNHKQYTTSIGETAFNIIILYPSTDFPSGASTSLVANPPYVVAVNQNNPPPTSNPVASTFFWIGLTDKTIYQRTETVSIIGTGYRSNELVTVNIRTSATNTLVYNNTLLASFAGQVTDSWLIPKNAVTEEGYIVTLTGTITSKSPADAQGFNIQPAIMSIPALSASKSTYQRTETMTFSFQPSYPSGEIATVGVGLITLVRPDGANITLTANYNSTTQTFVAKYRTSTTNQTGTWNATLAKGGYNDGYGNSGPGSSLSTIPQLQVATLSVAIQTKTSFVPFEQITFNATIRYPDGVNLQAGNSVTSTLSYSGGGYTVSIPVVFDNALQLWFGSYNPQGNEPSGQWSLSVQAEDLAQPPNNGSQTRVIQIQNRPPIAAFASSPNSALTGVSIILNATASSDSDGSIISYLWNFGDGSTGSGQITNHAYTTSGSYLVRLTVTDNSAATATADTTVIIQNRPPLPSITASTSTVSVGASVSFDATASNDPDGTITSYSWDFGDGTPGAGPTASHTFSNAGTFTVRLSITDNNGSTASTVYTVTVQTPSSSSENTSFPLYYFGIIAAIIAGGLAAFMAVKRHKVTHAKLKIDLEAVRSEAGRIENQEFFQSVKDQLKKDKEQA